MIGCMLQNNLEWEPHNLFTDLFGPILFINASIQLSLHQMFVESILEIIFTSCLVQVSFALLH